MIKIQKYLNEFYIKIFTDISRPEALNFSLCSSHYQAYENRFVCPFIPSQFFL